MHYLYSRENCNKLLCHQKHLINFFVPYTFLHSLIAGTNGDKAKITLYIMTSASTVEPTTLFFQEHNYFGLCSDQVVVFQQGTLPCFTFEGKIILNGRSEVARAPDGNGGLYRALDQDGVLNDMERRGVEFIQLYCVDNILVRVGDPVFTGYCISKVSIGFE